MRPPRVVITRPQEDAQVLASKLRAQGVEPIIEPMLEIAPLRGPPLELSGVQAILLTSANGARALADNLGSPPAGRDIAVYAVGEATAAAARAAGFGSVKAARGDVKGLVELVRAELLPADGRLLHVAGTAVAGDLAGELGADEYSVRRAVLYDARPVGHLSEPVRMALKAGDIELILFFSPRTAETFVTLVLDAGLKSEAQNVGAICLSAAVADAVRSLNWRSLRVASKPNQSALLEELAQELEGLRNDM